MMDQTFRKLIRPVDARGKKGIFLRGRPTYGVGGSSPNPQGKNQFTPDLIPAIKRRYRKS
jgi:hypothetical protein